MQRLDQLLEQTEDRAKQERVREALFDVAIRVQDLRDIEAVHLLYFARHRAHAGTYEPGTERSISRTLAVADQRR